MVMTINKKFDVKVVQAEKVGESERAHTLLSRDGVCYVPFTQSEIRGDVLYITQWIATKKEKEGEGEFVPGSNRKEMILLPKEVPLSDSDCLREILSGVMKIINMLETK
jgi:hypothetical protein